jgi:hypothetical protein
MDDRASLDLAAPAIDRPNLEVTAWLRPDGGLDVWFDDLAISADGGTAEEAVSELVAETRELIEHWLVDDNLRTAPNWRRRGPLLAWLSTIDDPDLRERMRVHLRSDAGRHLDDPDQGPRR